MESGPMDSQGREEEELRLLKAELDRIPHTDKFSYLLACTPSSPCRDEALALNAMGRNRHLAYLEAHGHDASVAASKIANYWEERLSLFGPERAHLPMTLHGALKDEVEWMMKCNVMQVLPDRDTNGRMVMFGDPGRRDMAVYRSKRQCMAMWYLLETIIHHEKSRKNGLVIVSNAAIYSQGSGMDPKFAEFCYRATDDIFPVHLQSIHFTSPSIVSQYLIFPIIDHVVGRGEKRQRFTFHCGTEEEILLQLETHGLKRSILPQELGGEVELDFKTWIYQRLAHEYTLLSVSSSAATPVSSPLGDIFSARTANISTCRDTWRDIKFKSKNKRKHVSQQAASAKLPQGHEAIPESLSISTMRMVHVNDTLGE